MAELKFALLVVGALPSYRSLSNRAMARLICACNSWASCSQFTLKSDFSLLEVESIESIALVLVVVVVNLLLATPVVELSSLTFVGFG